jgi:putative transposase
MKSINFRYRVAYSAHLDHLFWKTLIPLCQANQVWSWDITHLPSKVIGDQFCLYMIEDIYSRKIVSSEVHNKETGEYTSVLLQRAVWFENRIRFNFV